jgi:hypothetical protein
MFRKLKSWIAAFALVALAGPLMAVCPITFDPATVTATTLSLGNLQATNTGTTSADQGAHTLTSSGKSSGKYYYEMSYTLATAGANVGVGVGTTASTYTAQGGGAGGMMFSGTGNIYTNSIFSTKSISGRSTADVVAVAVDITNLKIWFKVAFGSGSGGDWNNTVGADPATNTGGLAIPAGTYIPFVVFGGTSGAAGGKWYANFGNTNFILAVPSGFTSGWPA